MKLKKVLATVSAVVLSLSMSFTAFAAEVTGLTECEQELYDYISAGITAGDFSYEFKAADLNKAISYMQANDLTQDDVDTIIAQIDEATSLLESNGITKLSDIDSDLAAQLVEIANGAGSIVGVEFEVTADGNISVIGADGENYTTIPLNEESSSTGEINSDEELESNDGATVGKRGYGLETTAAVVGLLAVTLASCAVYAKKRTVEA